MITPIYQIFIGKNNIAANLAAKSVPQAEKDEMNKKQMASLDAVGAKVLLLCNSAWANEENPWWGLIRFPSLEARIQHTHELSEMGWLDWVDAFTLLGTSESEPAVVTFPNPIYKLWLIRSDPSGAQAQNSLARGTYAAVFEKHNAIYAETGSVVVLHCDSYWCSESYPFFGISAYPNIEANMKVMQTLADLGWLAVTDSFSLLGIPQS